MLAIPIVQVCPQHCLRTRCRAPFREGGESGLKIPATDVVDEERKTLT